MSKICFKSNQVKNSTRACSTQLETSVRDAETQTQVTQPGSSSETHRISTQMTEFPPKSLKPLDYSEPFPLRRFVHRTENCPILKMFLRFFYRKTEILLCWSSGRQQNVPDILNQIILQIRLLYRNFPGENQKLSSRSTALFRRSTILYNYIPSAPNLSVTEAATSLRTCSLEQSYNLNPSFLMI